MAAIAPVNIFGASQTHEGLIDKGSWLKSMAGPFAAKAVAGNPAQVG